MPTFRGCRQSGAGVGACGFPRAGKPLPPPPPPNFPGEIIRGQNPPALMSVSTKCCWARMTWPARCPCFLRVPGHHRRCVRVPGHHRRCVRVPGRVFVFVHFVFAVGRMPLGRCGPGQPRHSPRFEGNRSAEGCRAAGSLGPVSVDCCVCPFTPNVVHVYSADCLGRMPLGPLAQMEWFSNTTSQWDAASRLGARQGFA